MEKKNANSKQTKQIQPIRPFNNNNKTINKHINICVLHLASFIAYFVFLMCVIWWNSDNCLLSVIYMFHLMLIRITNKYNIQVYIYDPSSQTNLNIIYDLLWYAHFTELRDNKNEQIKKSKWCTVHRAPSNFGKEIYGRNRKQQRWRWTSEGTPQFNVQLNLYITTTSVCLPFEDFPTSEPISKYLNWNFEKKTTANHSKNNIIWLPIKFVTQYSIRISNFPFQIEYENDNPLFCWKYVQCSPKQ